MTTSRRFWRMVHRFLLHACHLKIQTDDLLSAPSARNIMCKRCFFLSTNPLKRPTMTRSVVSVDNAWLCHRAPLLLKNYGAVPRLFIHYSLCNRREIVSLWREVKSTVPPLPVCHMGLLFWSLSILKIILQVKKVTVFLKKVKYRSGTIISAWDY